MNKGAKKDVIFLIGAELLFFSTPLYMTYLPNIEHVTACFRETNAIRGLFLAIPFRMVEAGMDELSVCRISIFVMNLLTCVFSWYVSAKIAGNAYAGLAGNLCYTFSVYSMFIRYEAGALGELAAYAFVPLVLYGLWKLVTGKGKKKAIGAFSAAAGLIGIFCSGIPVIPGNILLYRIWPAVVVIWSLFVCLLGKYIYNRKKRYIPVFLMAVVVFNIFGGMYYMNQLLYFPEGSGIL